MLKKIKEAYASWRRWDATGDSINRNSLLFTPAATDAQKEFTAHDRKTLMRFSRYLRDNLGITQGIITEVSRYSVGSDVMVQAATEDENWNDLAEEWWKEWQRSADISGRFSFGQLVDIWCQAMFTDGDVFVVKTQAKDGRPALQTIYGHAVDGNDDGYIDGIKYDSLMMPAFYRLATGRKIPAQTAQHIMEPRPNRLRGVPAVAHAANNLFDLRDILSFEKQGVKLNSSIAVVLKQQMSGNATGNRFLGPSTQTVSGNEILTLEQIIGGAQVPKIGPNDDITIHRSDKTSATFTGFLEWLIRDFAVGFGVPYEFAWDATKVQGTAQRFVMAKAQRRFTQIQHTFENHLSRIYEYVIASAITNGDLPPHVGWWKSEFVWPKKATVDFGRESREERENILANLKSLKDHYAEEQKDYRKQLRQIKDEHELLEELGISLGQQRNEVDNSTENPQ